MQLLRDNLVCAVNTFDYDWILISVPQTLWTSSEAEPAGDPAAAAETAAETKEAPATTTTGETAAA